MGKYYGNIWTNGKFKWRIRKKENYGLVERLYNKSNIENHLKAKRLGWQMIMFDGSCIQN